MAMGRRKEERQESLFIASGSLQAPRHVFYERLNRILSQHGFDRFVEELCRPFYAEKNGRPGLAPGVYFRTLFIGYFEGIDSERGMAWRIEDSLSLRAFLGFTLSDSPPDHSTLSRTRRLIDVETHDAVFGWMLKILSEEGLIDGRTVGGIDEYEQANEYQWRGVKHDGLWTRKDHRRLHSEARCVCRFGTPDCYLTIRNRIKTMPASS